jgi:hypothetical protein
MNNLATLKQAAVKAAEKFAAARDELVKTEAAFNAAWKAANPNERHAVDLGRPLNFSNTVCTDC